MGARAIRAAARDLDGVVQRLGQIGEQRRHFLGRFEIMLRRQAAARFGLIDIGALRNADHGVMGLEHLGLGEIDVVCGHKRQVARIGQFDAGPLGQALGRGHSALAGVALQLDVKPVGIDRAKPRQQRLGLGRVAGLKQPPKRPIRPAAQTDQPGAMGGQFVQRDMRHAAIAAQIKRGIQGHQVLVALPVLCQQHKGRGRHRSLAGADRVMGHIDLTSDDGLHPGFRGGFRKLQRAKHVVAVGHRHRRHAGIGHHPGQLFDPHRPFEQGILGVQSQMDESRIGHGESLS